MSNYVIPLRGGGFFRLFSYDGTLSDMLNSFKQSKVTAGDMICPPEVYYNLEYKEYVFETVVFYNGLAFYGATYAESESWTIHFAALGNVIPEYSTTNPNLGSSQLLSTTSYLSYPMYFGLVRTREGYLRIIRGSPGAYAIPDGRTIFASLYFDSLLEGSIVSVAPAQNGTVTTDVSIASAGDTVTVTVTPDSGYQLESLSVFGAEEGPELTQIRPGVFTFLMPENDVTVSATFETEPLLPPRPVSDYAAFVKGFLTGQALKAAQDAPAYFLPNPDPHGGSYERDSFLMGLAFGRAAAAKF